MRRERYSRLILFIIPLMIMLMLPLKAYAYESWVNPGGDAESAVQTVVTDSASDTENQEESRRNVFAEMIAEIIFHIGQQLHSKFAGDESGFDISINGLLTGELAQFSLNNGNVYGVAGAAIYTALRGSVYALFFVYACWLLLQHAFKSSSKGLVELKEGIVSIALAFTMIYLFPQLVDVCVSLRGQWARRINTSLLAASTGSGTLNLSEAATTIETGYIAAGGYNIWMALIYLGLQFAPFYYLVNYVTIAFTEAVLFGAYPVLCLLGFKNKKLMTDFYGTFISNLFIPTIDTALFSIPAMMFNLSIGKDGSRNVVIYALVLVTVWCIQPARNGIMRVLGNVAGIGGMGRGMGSLGMLAANLTRRMMMKGLRSGGRGESGESGGNEISSCENAKVEQSNADIEKASSKGIGGADLGDTVPGTAGASAGSEDGSVHISDLFDDNYSRGEDTGSVNAEASADVEASGVDATGSADIDASGMSIDGMDSSVNTKLSDMDESVYTGSSPVGEPVDGIEALSADEAATVSDVATASAGAGATADALSYTNPDTDGNAESATGGNSANVDERAANLSALDKAREDQVSAQNAISQSEANIAQLQSALPELQSNADSSRANFDKISSAENKVQTGIQKQMDGNTSRIETLQSENSRMQAKLGSNGATLSAEDHIRPRSGVSAYHYACFNSLSEASKNRLTLSKQSRDQGCGRLREKYRD